MSVFKKLGIYAIGGGIAAGVDLLFLYIFTEYAGFYYLLSQVIAFCISFIVCFSFQKYITFGQHAGNILHQSAKFLIFQLVGLAINVGILYVVVDAFGLYYIFGSIIAKAIVFLRNFGMNYSYNFSSGKQN